IHSEPSSFQLSSHILIEMASFKMTCLALLIASALIMSVSAHHPPGSPCWDNVDVGVACPAGSQGQSGTRYFHNHDDDKCEPFAYKGCGG
ncbi:hypothetical protein GN156_29785, partial [bacterium LRH843]|nr:hypothetical protein [bacterium LRH843]